VVAHEGDEALARAAPDAVVCLLGGRRRGAPLLHLPDVSTSRHLASAGAAGWALDHLVLQTPARRAVAAAVARAPVLARALPRRSTIVRPPGARPLLAWLPGGPPQDFVLTRGRRFAIRLLERGRLVAVAKLGGSTSRVAAPPGVEVPQLLETSVHDGLAVAVESGIEGRAAALVLGERPRLLGEVLDRLAGPLERWSRETASDRRADAALLEREVLAPARALAAELPEEYPAWLEGRCSEVEGMALPAVAAHNDLTMANVLLGRRGGIGIVDWDTARADGLPLVDFLYASVDAHAAADRYRDPAESFAACIASPEVEAHRARLAAALGLEPAVAELCFHACWLGHAANEAGRPEGTRPFLRIVRRLAAGR